MSWGSLTFELHPLLPLSKKLCVSLSVLGETEVLVWERQPESLWTMVKETGSSGWAQAALTTAGDLVTAVKGKSRGSRTLWWGLRSLVLPETLDLVPFPHLSDRKWDLSEPKGLRFSLTGGI